MLGETVQLIVFALIGVAIGWFLWGRKAAAGDAENARLRADLGERDTQLAEADRTVSEHQSQVSALTGEVDSHRTRVESHEQTITELSATAREHEACAGQLEGAQDTLTQRDQELGEQRSRADDLAAQLAEQTARADAAAAAPPAAAAVAEAPAQVADSGTTPVTPQPLISQPEPAPEATTSPEVAPDVKGGAGVLGRPLKLDDLKVIEGIGPAIERLCHARGIETWRALSHTPVAELQDILDGGGRPFKMHDPATWPEQARLLAVGAWAEFKTLTDQLSGGRTR